MLSLNQVYKLIEQGGESQTRMQVCLPRMLLRIFTALTSDLSSYFLTGDKTWESLFSNQPTMWNDAFHSLCTVWLKSYLKVRQSKFNTGVPANNLGIVQKHTSAVSNNGKKELLTPLVCSRMEQPASLTGI